MSPTTRPAFTERGAALTGFASFVIFSLAVGVPRHDAAAGLATGLLIGVSVFVAHWFAARRRR